MFRSGSGVPQRLGSGITKHVAKNGFGILAALAALAGCAKGQTAPDGTIWSSNADDARDATASRNAGGAPSLAEAGPAKSGAGGDVVLVDFGDIPERSPDASVARCGTKLTGTIRDFKQAHADFEELACICDDRAIVSDTLGADGKPVYAGNPTTPTTSGAANFDQWYRDVPGVNESTSFTFSLTQGTDDVWTYENNQFFPIDGRLFGDEGNSHNYHFTFELETEFIYRGGEVFNFKGDDDVFAFINGKKVVDLGGVHVAETATVNLDQEASRLGLEVGKTYPLAFFFAERHTVDSDFRIDTTLEFTKCGEIR